MNTLTFNIDTAYSNGASDLTVNESDFGGTGTFTSTATTTMTGANPGNPAALGSGVTLVNQGLFETRGRAVQFNGAATNENGATLRLVGFADNSSLATGFLTLANGMSNHGNITLTSSGTFFFNPDVRLISTAGTIVNETDGVINVVQGAGDTGRALAGHDGLDGLLFTGSATTGAHLARQFAETPWKMLALEMGGNNPLIVWDVDDAALDAAAALVVQSAYLSAGQRCTCARRLIVRDGAHDALIDRVTGLIDRIIVGAPFDQPQPFMGPVIDNRAADALQAGFAGLASRGGDVIRMLARRDMTKPLLSPGLIDVTDVADRPDSEMFGPVLQMIRVADFDAALAEANNTRFGLSAGLIGGDAALYDRFWQASRAGVVNWNRPTNGAASNAPFGGIGLSGNHRPSAYYAADYVAWPVASLEADAIEGSIATGLRA